MNIFVLDINPDIAAKSLCDKHVIKMILESAQILSAVHHKNNSPRGYKPTHQNHPCVKWAGNTIANYYWLLDHAYALCAEYTQRYGKIHKTEKILYEQLAIAPRIEVGELTPFEQCMPEQYHDSNPVKAYRQYYLGDKSRFAVWKHGNEPIWWSMQDANMGI